MTQNSPTRPNFPKNCHNHSPVDGLDISDPPRSSSDAVTNGTTSSEAVASIKLTSSCVSGWIQVCMYVDASTRKPLLTGSSSRKNRCRPFSFPGMVVTVPRRCSCLSRRSPNLPQLYMIQTTRTELTGRCRSLHHVAFMSTFFPSTSADTSLEIFGSLINPAWSRSTLSRDYGWAQTTGTIFYGPWINLLQAIQGEMPSVDGEVYQKFHFVCDDDDATPG